MDIICNCLKCSCIIDPSHAKNVIEDDVHILFGITNTDISGIMFILGDRVLRFASFIYECCVRCREFETDGGPGIVDTNSHHFH